MYKGTCLNDLSVGQKALVKEIKATGSMRRRLLDIGLINNTKIECVGQSPSGDPKAYLIRGAVIAIRSEDGKNILINLIDKED
ncbi:MAG: ferrous iron transport protein A [Ruminococcaceae bacterium]|nr:ferrous iron transport protein A [Oscillospiraceae bacterium]